MKLVAVTPLGKPNIGGFTLQLAYPSFATRGLLLGIAIHFAGLMVYIAVSGMEWVSNNDRSVKGILIAIDELPKPPRDPSVIVFRPDIESRPVIGSPVIVEDALGSDRTVATQYEIPMAISVPENTGTVGEIDITGVLATLNESKDSETFEIVEQPPVLLFIPKAEYPGLAKAAGLEGRVFLRALIGEQGDVLRIEPAGGDALFVEAASAALTQAKFKPGINGNRAVKVWITYPFTFRIR